jgi:hypothetical protein
MTKIEYREYIASADWQGRRKEFLATNNYCIRCEMPRWLAEIAYDQDLNVHHKSYANLGDEDWDDLEPLCRRCHEIEKFGRSDLREPKSTICENCRVKHWDPYCGFCPVCETVFGTRYLCKKAKVNLFMGHVIGFFWAALWVQEGRSREMFMRDMAKMYDMGEKAAPRIIL